MKIQLEQVLPKEIEERSFQIITQKLNEAVCVHCQAGDSYYG